MSETTAPAVTLVEFLERVLDEEQAAAEKAGGDAWVLEGNEDGGTICHERHSIDQIVDWVGDEAGHIVRHDPAHVLTGIQVKRRILADRPTEPRLVESVAAEQTADYEGALRQWESTVRLLALPYANHPAYDPAWRPE